MQKYVALLRGINVGGNSKVEMPRLRKVFEALGFKNVSTYINSGNVIFDGKERGHLELAQEIEKALQDHFGFAVRSVVRNAKNIEKISKNIPLDWTNDTKTKTDILFLWEEFDTKSSLNLIVAHPEVDKLKYIDGAIIWSLDRKGYTKSGMRKFIGTPLYKHMTARNVNTVRKLASLMKSK
ncbi:MAG: DUF1697 domain-containing protein [Patescibacteria group bacterium]